MRRGLIALTMLVAATGAIVILGQTSAFAASRLVVCGLVFAVLVVAAWAASGRVRDGLIVASSLVFGLAVLESASLALGLRPKVAAADGGISHARPIVGWGPTRPGIYDVVKKDTDGRVIYAAKVTIDNDLNRKTKPSQGPGAVAFFGDSFVFGDGVDDDGTLPQAFATLNHGAVPVLNLGFSGWSPSQNLAALQMDLYKPLLDSPRHFVLFTSPFHLERTACKGPFAVSPGPRYAVQEGTLRLAGECAGRLSRLLAPLYKFAQGFAVVQRASAVAATPTRDDVQTYIKLIETFVTTAREKYGVKTTVLFWPTGDTPFKGTGYTEARLLDELRRNNIDVLADALPDVDEKNDLYRIAGDGHPTALANASTARLLQDHLRKVDPQAVAADTTAR